MPCPFFSGFHDNVLQDFVVIAKKVESNFLNHYNFEYITPSQTHSNITAELKENRNFNCTLSTGLGKNKNKAADHCHECHR